MANRSAKAQARLSYDKSDDQFLNLGITWLFHELEADLHGLTNGRVQVVGGDTDSLFHKELPDQIENAGDSPSFLIPILTPSYFANERCRREAATFLDFKKQAGRRALIFPIYLITADVLEDPARRSDDAIVSALFEHKYADWRSLAHDLGLSLVMEQRVFQLAEQIDANLERASGEAPPIIPEQGPGVRFRINEDGLIDRAPDEPHDADENEARLNSLKIGLIEACDRLLGSSGHNTLGFVLDTIQAYRGAIDRPLVDVQYTDVWRHGQRLQNLADAATRDVDRLEPSLEDDQHAALSDLLDLHGPFMLSTAEGRALQAMADRHQATREQQERQKEAVQAFKEAIEDSRGLVTDAVRQVIVEASDDFGKGLYPERAAITSETTNRNFLSTAGKTAAYVGNHAAGGIIGGVAVGTALGSGIVGVSVEALNAAGQASTQFILNHQMMLKGLVACSTDGLSWLHHVIGWVKQRQIVQIEPPSRSSQAQPLRITETFWTPGRVFRDIDEAWCPEMVVVPAGEFFMGSPEDEEGRSRNEGPQHSVTLGRPFALGRYPVTFAEYEHFCNQTNREKPTVDAGVGRWRRPVVDVSWIDTKAYCDWLSEVTKNNYRLPTEAEWEYACRVGTTTAFAFGDTITTKQANYGGAANKTTKVGIYPTSPFKLFDMHGNVWEWCDDEHPRQYETDPATNPRGFVGSQIVVHGGMRAMRGGSWHQESKFLRSAQRGMNPPHVRSAGIGFRCARVQDA